MDSSITPLATTDALQWAHPIVREWFLTRLGVPTEPQEQGWPHILRRTTTLISAPTGSGKTLAAFLACIDRLVRKALTGELQDRTEVLYVSPLKALSNDIKVNLEIPLGEIQRLAMERGLLMPEIRAAVRTGDTLMHERRAMLQRPPHILVTTPESLYILLTAEKSREILKSVDTVIVDEIHAVADDKRGAHLALTLERLDVLAERLPLRIGLSATQKPIETIARFLTGDGRTNPMIVQIGHQRQVDLAVEVPASELGPVATHEMWGEIYDRIAELVKQRRSTLVFVNTRRLAERVAHHLAERLGEEAVATHHGSLSRKLRLAAEKKLKAGEIRALVATASLELGIDIGAVDLVCQVGSTRSIAVAWQRIGRAGHWHGAIPKGRIFATTRDELVESAALVRAMRTGDLDKIEIPKAPMDVLAQQIVAMCACDDWKEEELFARVRQAYPYRDLERAAFDSIVEMLFEGIAARRGRYGSYLMRDRVNGRLHGRRGSRLVAITNGGAIPDNSLYAVMAEPEGTPVGTVDEDFAVESLAGDIMLLGNSSWRIRRVSAGRVIVEDAKGAAPNIPFWRGEAPARTAELSSHVGGLREKVAELTRGIVPGTNLRTSAEAVAAVEWLGRECGLDRAGGEQLIAHLVAGRTVLGAVPTQTTVIAERFFDESGGMQLVIHAPFGGRVNKAWGLALRKRFCRSFNLELQAAATDDGINISLAEQHSFPLGDVFRFLHPASVKEVLEQAVLPSPIFTARWRWDASRALVLQRFQHGKKVAPPIQRMRADDLLAAVFPDAAACPENLDAQPRIPEHPLVQEVMKDALTEAMDVEGLKLILERVVNGSIQCIAVDTPIPSQFSHEILNANPFAYLDDAPLEERRARAVEMRRTLPESVLSEVGKLDPEAIAEVRGEAWPDARDADELHDALQTLIALPEVTESGSAIGAVVRESALGWHSLFEELRQQNRAAVGSVGGRRYWVAAERAKSFARLFAGAEFASTVAEVEGDPAEREEVVREFVAGWMEHCGPVTARELADVLGLAQKDVDAALLQIEGSGAVLRGKFTDPTVAETEWCGRRLLARIHRLTLGRLRREIEPVNAAQFMRWLFRWQHVVRGTQLAGERGTLEVLRQLQGYEAPANTWEHQILGRRVIGYDPKNLNQLCLSGAVGWGRFSPHPAMMEDSGERGRRVAPSSVAPITFFVREDAEWMSYPRREWAAEEHPGLSPAARDVLQFLKQHGASFFADIVRGTRKLKAEIETALWELVAVGFITADGFDNLRALIDPKRRAGQGSGRMTRPRDSVGRWSLLSTGEAAEAAGELEAICWMLLKRYGVVFREVLTRESILPRWREVLIALRRLEDRGEIRGGRFVSGFVGEQFALPVAVESLRASRNEAATGEVVTVAAADPLNLAGIVVPGEKVAANSRGHVSFRDGVVIEEERREWEPMANAG
ncbi:MAG TPA: DEAD/DEAH box helicase [Verrucomicrobiae bacterium]|nr:DEAD/DEAH box helicase [Verrucomicrobiae bacterium]